MHDDPAFGALLGSFCVGMNPCLMLMLRWTRLALEKSRFSSIMAWLLRDRIMVVHAPLEGAILVRVQVPQQNKKHFHLSVFLFLLRDRKTEYCFPFGLESHSMS